MSKKKLFIICLAGGLAFGALFFVFFGLEAGYSWLLAGSCLGGGLLFCVLFFPVWLFVQKFSKPITFENPKAQARLEENEITFEEKFEKKFTAFLPYGKRLKKAVCETAVYLFQSKLRIVFCYFRKIYTIDLAYGEIMRAVTSGAEVEIYSVWDEGCSVYLKLKNEENRFAEMLQKKGVCVQAGSSEFE